MPASTRPEGPTGVGLGLRWEFLDEVLAADALDVAFFELSPENVLGRGGALPRALEGLSQRYPLLSHGLSISLGGIEEPAAAHLEALAALLRRWRVPWHSEHLSFTQVGRRALHELFPLPRTRANLERCVARCQRLRRALGVPLAVENISYYAELGAPELSEVQFLRELVERADVGLLLDVNNVWVNANNHGYDAREFIAALPLAHVWQLHVAGHERRPDGLLVDTHSRPVCQEVQALLGWTLERTGPLPVLLERDHEIPPLAVLLDEVQGLQRLYDAALGRWQAGGRG